MANYFSIKRTLLCTFITLTATAGAQEREPIITDRPDFTESTETVPTGMTQIEGGFTLSRVGNSHDASYGEVLIRHAVGRNTELRFEAPNYVTSRNDGLKTSDFEDGSIGFKTILASGAGYGFKKPRVSVIGSVGLPAGSREVRGSGVQPGIKLLMGVDLNERLSLSSNLNAAYLKDEAGRFNEFSGSVSLGIGLSERLGSYVEVYGFAPSGNRQGTKYLNGGFTYLLNPDLQLDARLGTGIANDTSGSDTFIGFGIANRF